MYVYIYNNYIFIFGFFEISFEIWKTILKTCKTFFNMELCCLNYQTKPSLLIFSVSNIVYLCQKQKKNNSFAHFGQEGTHINCLHLECASQTTRRMRNDSQNPLIRTIRLHTHTGICMYVCMYACAQIHTQLSARNFALVRTFVTTICCCRCMVLFLLLLLLFVGCA